MLNKTKSSETDRRKAAVNPAEHWRNKIALKISTPGKGGGREIEKGGGTQLKTDRPIIEHLETLAKTAENPKFLEGGRGDGGTPKRKNGSNLSNNVESPAKKRKILTKEFNFEKLCTFWTGNKKNKPSDLITEKNILGNTKIAKLSHSLKPPAE